MSKSAVILACIFLSFMAVTGLAAEEKGQQKPVLLRAWGVPTDSSSIPHIATLKVLAAFEEKFPYIKPVSSTGIMIPGGSRTMDMVPLMQIAGDIPAHVMYVNFRQSDTYIRNKFLYPLDKYVEGMLDLDIKNGPTLTNEQYLEELKNSPLYKTLIAPRVPLQTWAVMRRECPYGEDCEFCKKWGVKPGKKHYHIWAFPQGSMVMALLYRKDMFHAAGLPDRAPETLEEMYDWAKKLTRPERKEYGMWFSRISLSWSTLSILYSYGGLIVSDEPGPDNPNGEWRCVFDRPEAVDAYYYVARLFHQPFKTGGGEECSSPVYLEGASGIKVAMQFKDLNARAFNQLDPSMYNFGPVPRGPTGKRGSEFNCAMTGIFAGLEGEKNKAIRDAAWEYILFYNGIEARKIRTKAYVENGLARFVQPNRLIEAGYEDFVRQVPDSWNKAYKEALANGIPEPYGKNCQLVYDYASRAIDQIRTSNEVKEAIVAGDEARAKKLIGTILSDQVRRTNVKMLNVLEPKERKTRNTVAAIVVISMFVGFILLFRKVFKVFDSSLLQEHSTSRSKWQFGRYKWAYLLLIIPVGSVVLWQYYPLARGTVMAFQHYNIRGFSEWVGMENFAAALYDDEFWFSMYVTLKYALLFGLFGFTAPIVLAFLLTEVPKGKVFFRTLYYLPAVLSGLIVIYLWKGFYNPDGMLNQLINYVITAINTVFHADIALMKENWLESPRLALFCILLPVIWGGMGPGCLIYLAALKTVPEEIYEAADIDGAGIFSKIFNVAIPNIKALIMINFIGVMVATFKGSGNMALAMTGGGPFTPYGETEFVGLKIFYQAFGFLRFGVATAMAWILGSMLVGFTVIQLQKLSKMEFKTAGSTK